MKKTTKTTRLEQLIIERIQEHIGTARRVLDAIDVLATTAPSPREDICARPGPDEDTLRQIGRLIDLLHCELAKLDPVLYPASGALARVRIN